MIKGFNYKLGLAFVSICLIISLGAGAQGNGGNDPDIPDIPLDGGLSLLLGAGAVYAGKKLRERKSDKNGGRQAK
jgi:hypothetical protein